MSDVATRAREVTLLDLLDRIVDNGVVLAGDVTLSVERRAASAQNVFAATVRELRPAGPRTFVLLRAGDVALTAEVTGEALTVSTTSPRSVNLTALASRLSKICRSRVTSPRIAAGTSPSNK